MKIYGYNTLCEGASLEKMMPLLKDEVSLMWQKQKEGVLREVYLRTDVHLVVIVLECADVDEAKRVMGEFPMVKNNLIEFHFMPVTVFEPFQVLFEGFQWGEQPAS